MIKRNKTKKQIENTKKKEKIVNSRELNKSEKDKRIEFIRKVGRSLDAAKAVNEAYQYKEKQNSFQKRLNKNKIIRQNVQQEYFID